MATIILKHSTVKDKLPSSAQFGEVFVNYHNENPFLATLNNQGQFEKFLSENKTKELFYTKSQVNDIIANLESGGTIEFDDYYKKNEVDTLLQSKSDIGHTHSYTALTDLPDLSIYLTEHQDLSGYAQKSDLDDYLTIASASTIYATKEELEEHIPTVDAYTKAETDTLLAGKANSAHTHDYETLTNKPDLSNFATKGEIPDTNGFATKQELEDYQMKSGMSAYLLASEAQDTYQPKGTYVVPSDLNNYVTSGYAEETFAKKGDVSKIWKGTLAEYTNLTDIDPDTLYVITDESEQFVTSGDVESMISGYTTLSEVEVLLGGFSPTGHTHSVSDITDLDIPSLEGYATEAWVGANYQPISAMSEYSTTAHTHDYSEIQNTPDLSGFASLSDIPDTSNFITSGFCEDHYQAKGTYVIPSDLDDYALKTDLPTVPDSYTKTETDNLLAGKANSAHTHTVSEITDLVIPSLEGYATEAELANYMPNSGMTDYVTDSELNTALEGYSQTGHTHSQYLTETSADTRYARVVSLTQAEYDALVQNDQVEQGVLYCIYEGSQSNSGNSGDTGNSGNSGNSGNTGTIPDDTVIPDPDDGGNDF